MSILKRAADLASENANLMATASLLREAKTKRQKWLGVDVTPQMDRIKMFWEDVLKAQDVFWGKSLTHKLDVPSRNHIYFESTGPFGSLLKVLIDGPPTAEYVDIMVDVSKDGVDIEHQKRRFGYGKSIQEMIEWIDAFAVKQVRGK